MAQMSNKCGIRLNKEYPITGIAIGRGDAILK